MSLTERKKFIQLHAIAQGMDMQEFRDVLEKIYNDDGVGPGDWCMEFTSIADKYFVNKKYNEALQYYNLARYPYIDTIVKQKAYYFCIKAFENLCKNKNLDVKKMAVKCGDVDVPFYFYQSVSVNAPLLLVMGGIVSIKEQWIQFLKLGDFLNCSVCLVDFPGVGENQLIYTVNSHLLIKNLLDSLRNYTNIDNVHCIGMSFGGYLMLKQAANDKRICSVITVGAPIHDFFVNGLKWKFIPAITKKCLSHSMKNDTGMLFNLLSKFSIRDEIAKNNIPLCYIFSNQDEIISQSEKDNLLNHCNNLELYSFDDEHGSPNHMKITKLIIIYSLLKFTSKKSLLRVLIKLKIKLYQLKLGFSILTNKGHLNRHEEN